MAIQRLHAPAPRARSAGGRLRPKAATAPPKIDQDQHPQQHRAFVVAPGAGDLVEHRLGRVRVGGDVEHREVGDDVGVHQAAEGDGHQQELRQRAHGRPAPSTRRCRARPPASAASPAPERRRAPGSGRNGRARRSLRCSFPASGRPAAGCPSCAATARTSSARRRPPAACSSRRAWPAPGRRRRRRRAAAPRRPRPGPRGTGPAARRCR